MEIDRTVVIVGILLLVVLGIYAISQMGGDSTGSVVSSGARYASQVAGGGCGG